MLRLFFAAVLAAIAMPAQAAYIVEIEAQFTFVHMDGTPDGVPGDHLDPYYSGLPVTFSMKGVFDTLVPHSGTYGGLIEHLTIGDFTTSGATVTVKATRASLTVESYGSPVEGEVFPAFSLLFFNNPSKFPIFGFSALSYLESSNAEHALFLEPRFTKVYFDEALTAPIPEPATWAMMIAGFGLLGGMLRRPARHHLGSLECVASPVGAWARTVEPASPSGIKLSSWAVPLAKPCSSPLPSAEEEQPFDKLRANGDGAMALSSA